MANTSSTHDDGELRAASIARGDPLLRWLCKADVPPILMGVAYTVLFNLIRGFSAWSAGHLFTSGTVTGFFNDPSVWSRR